AVRERSNAISLTGDCNEILRELADNLSTWIADISTFPELEKLSSRDFARYLWVPSVGQRLRFLRRYGSPSEIKHARRLLRSILSKSGRPQKKLEDTADFQIFETWRAASNDPKFHEGVVLYLRRKADGGYASDDEEARQELTRIGLSTIHVNATVGCRDFQNA